MAYLLGVVLFALAIFVSVSLHEAGHMLTAKAFGMKVTRFFVGFGPTLFSFNRRGTEYGIKAIPAGAFVKIVGMTPQDDDVSEEDQPRAMWRYPVWKRTIVMAAGSMAHFILGVVLLWFTLVFVGVANPNATPDKQPATIGVADCVVATDSSTACAATDPKSPAAVAGLKNGDTVTVFNGKTIKTYQDLQYAVRAAKVGPTSLTYVRDGQSTTTTVDLVSASRHPIDNPDGTASMVPALGITWQLPAGVSGTVTYGPIGSVGKTASLTGQVFASMGSALAKVPEKVPALWNALSGKPRDPNTPMSVVGASRLGGESVQHGAWALFLSILIGLNFFIGVFNLVPLLPLDGGHIAIAWFERARSWLYARIGRRDPGRVDYNKLMPLTYAVILIFGGFTVLAVAADIVNPITLFSK